MEVLDLSIPDVKCITPRAFPDGRGFFQQTYHEQEYREAGLHAQFVQDNWSRSSQGVLRGLHYQLKHAQDKLISVLHGEVLDVAVDIRRGSPTFGQWVGEILSDTNHVQLFVPKGFAHGFCVLSDRADIVYKCSDFYAPDDEYAVRWDDPDLAIEWPRKDVVVSEKDQMASVLKNIPEANLPVYCEE